jgi:hypothetical protein
VVDDFGNEAYKSITISVIEEDVQKPVLSLMNPKSGLYIFGEKVLNINGVIIIGKVTIQATATDNIRVDRVDFYIDDSLSFRDTSLPYEWRWNDVDFGHHEIKIVAVDEGGNQAEKTIDIIKII